MYLVIFYQKFFRISAKITPFNLYYCRIFQYVEDVTLHWDFPELLSSQLKMWYGNGVFFALFQTAVIKSHYQPLLQAILVYQDHFCQKPWPNYSEPVSLKHPVFFAAWSIQSALWISKVLCDFTFFPLRPRGTGIDRPGKGETLKTWIEKNPWTWKGLGNLQKDEK